MDILEFFMPLLLGFVIGFLSAIYKCGEVITNQREELQDCRDYFRRMGEIKSKGGE